MSTIRIYTPQILQSDSSLTLEAAASNHLLRVLRCRVGQVITVFNGLGGEYTATLTAIHKVTAQIQVSDFALEERLASVRLELAPALLGGSRMDLIIQKAVELGVDSLTPILTRRVEAKIPTQRLASRLDHWQKVVINACEQCGRNRLMQVQPPIEIGEWLHNCRSAVKLLGDPQGISWSAITPPQPGETVSFLLGPEGGYTAEEHDAIRQQHFQGVTFGARILRAETAAIAAAVLVQGMWSR